ncbi:chemotaxis response regulator protein-glutamate methylesterase [Paenibacillus albicereus]|uniref:Protein-glutamate methylesterase/protein-glutamine glutaminase n=1 Tax=Paenibacillus albicereus TaxID=2726185 RepID=A0A6H2GYS5_9BACL|nr:chemotaxis response regulator protein-glutamate methylesterase [Paenibacillus albicereus]QJC52268.1 chemotaxis response regulator protein-glutamate methylesterase [Paenibacillus albicereus]
MSPYRVLVVDDSAFMRAVIKDLIEEDPAFEVAGMARNGIEAVEAASRLNPDAMTLDLEMPEMNGIDALEAIMASNPLPVIMFSGMSEEHASLTIAALQQGAFDFIRKPAASSPPGEISTIGRLLREKLHTAVLIRERIRRQQKEAELAAAQAKAAVPPQPEKPAAPAADRGAREAERAKAPAKRSGTAPGAPSAPAPKRAAPKLDKPAGREAVPPQSEAAAGRPARGLAPSRPPKPPAAPKGAEAGSRAFKHLIAVGTSTGGPRALQQLIAGLPEDLPAPVLIVQHMPPRFTASLAKRLDAAGPLAVHEAVDGQPVRAGHVYLAPGGNHMRLDRDEQGFVIRLSQDEPVSGHRPSVDVLYRSLVPHGALKRHGVILTGMGSDGAKGMLELKDSGAVSTIAESEESCVVYGMPRSCVENGSCDTVLPLASIAKELAVRCLG